MTDASAKNRAIFFDRDGVLNVDTGYLFRIEDFEWISGAPEAVAWAAGRGYQTIVVTNQSGIARGYYTEADMSRLHQWMNEDLQRRTGCGIDAFYHSPFHPDASIPAFKHADHPDRKPNPGMVLRAIQDFSLSPEACLMIGDKQSDVEAARRSNVPGLLFQGGNLLQALQSAL